MGAEFWVRSIYFAIMFEVFFRLRTRLESKKEKVMRDYEELPTDWLTNPGMSNWWRGAPGRPVPFKVHVPGCAPSQSYASDAAWDLPVAEEVELWPGKPTKVSTGLSFAIPAEHFGDIRPRSSATLLGIDIAGTVDAAYRGVVYVLATNLTSEPITVRPGQRIGQMIVMPRPRVRMAEVEELPEGERGAAGFGSTGG